MLTSMIQPFIKERNFSGAIEILFSQYTSLESDSRKVLDNAITILSFWKNYEYNYPKDSVLELYSLWNEFDTFLIHNQIFSCYDVVSLIGESIMDDIHQILVFKNIQVHDAKPFLNKLIYVKSLIWTNQIKIAFSFLSSLVKNYPLEPEPWFLMGRLYSDIDIKKSTLFYREAFFIDPSLLNLIDGRTNFLDMVIAFYKKNDERQYSIKQKEHFLQWLGIWGSVGKFFDVRMDLTPTEESVMNQRIVVYENRYFRGDKKDRMDYLNLLRLYLFQEDYYKYKQEYSLTEDIRNKIEILSPTIYTKIK